jgi:hypothetical protein
VDQAAVSGAGPGEGNHGIGGERDLPEPLRKAVERLEPQLLIRGYRLAVERYDPECFGSAYVDYVSSTGDLRLVWDGRDSSLRADHRNAPTDWTTLIELQASGTSCAAQDAVDAFVARVNSVLEGRRTDG